MPGKREEYLTWEEHFMGIALVTAARSKDPSTQVGACIADSNNRILSTGYNGLTQGMNDDTFYWNSIGEQTGELMKIKNPFVVHAERNAILNYRGSRQDLENSTLYVTWYPCSECTKEIIQAGIKRVVYLGMYSKPEDVEISKIMFQAAGVEVYSYNSKREFSKPEIRENIEGVQKMLKRFSN